MSGSDIDTDAHVHKSLRSGRRNGRRKESGACVLCNKGGGDIMTKGVGPSKTVSGHIHTLKGACVVCNPRLAQFVEIAKYSNPAGDLLSVHTKRTNGCIGWDQFSLYARAVVVSDVPRLTVPRATLQHSTH